MIATLIRPSFFCVHPPHTHCGTCIAEFIRPDLTVVITRWAVLRLFGGRFV